MFSCVTDAGENLPERKSTGKFKRASIEKHDTVGECIGLSYSRLMFWKETSRCATDEEDFIRQAEDMNVRGRAANKRVDNIKHGTVSLAFEPGYNPRARRL